MEGVGIKNAVEHIKVSKPEDTSGIRYICPCLHAVVVFRISVLVYMLLWYSVYLSLCTCCCGIPYICPCLHAVVVFRISVLVCMLLWYSVYLSLFACCRGISVYLSLFTCCCSIPYICPCLHAVVVFRISVLV